MQGAVEQRQAFVDQDLDGVLGLAGLVEPTRRGLLALEGSEGADRGRPGQPQGRGLRLGLAGPAPLADARGRGADPLQDEDALLRSRIGGAGQVAPVAKRQGPGEIELDEPEQGQSPLPAERPPLVVSGSEYLEGWTGTSGFSISPRRVIRRCHCSGFSSAANLASLPVAVGW